MRRAVEESLERYEQELVAFGCGCLLFRHVLYVCVLCVYSALLHVEFLNTHLRTSLACGPEGPHANAFLSLATNLGLRRGLSDAWRLEGVVVTPGD